MNADKPNRQRGDSSAFLALAFRPFFLAASVWSALSLAMWITMFMAGLALPSRFDPLTWHIHEMLFGFVLAAIAGFMLTAIPTWTGRPPLHGAYLAGLAALWLLGRITCLLSAWIPLWLAAVLDLGFPFVLCSFAAREIISARNWRNVAMPVPVGVLGIANLLMYFEQAGRAVAPGLGWRLGLAAIIVLISVVGGRIIPAFTRNWLLKRGAVTLPRSDWLLIDRAALATLHGGLIGWTFFPQFHPLGVLLVLAAAFNLWRLACWHGLTTLSEPLLAILHIGYLWVIVGVALLGANLLSTVVPISAAIHALTAGAIGTMVIAVMTRVALGHTGRVIEADRITTMIYLIVMTAAIIRIIATVAGGASIPLLGVSAILWVAGFGLFSMVYGPILISPRCQ